MRGGISLGRERFCIECGRTEREVKLTSKMLCVDCFLRKYPLYEVKNRRIKVKLCPMCHSYAVRRNFARGRGLSFSEAIKALIEDSVNKMVKLPFYSKLTIVDFKAPENFVKNRFLIPVIVETKHVEEDVAESFTLEIEVYAEKCPLCKRKEKGVSEAIIQIRKERGKLSYKEREKIIDLLRELAEKSRDPKAYIANVEATGSGVDVWIGSLKFAEMAARVLRKRFNGSMKIFRTFGGLNKSGKHVLTASILIKIP